MLLHQREDYERMIREFPDRKHYGKIIPLYLCGQSLTDPQTQQALFRYLSRNSTRFGTPRRGPFGILFLDSDDRRAGAFLDDIFDDQKKEIYSAVENLELDCVGALV